LQWELTWGVAWHRLNHTSHNQTRQAKPHFIVANALCDKDSQICENKQRLGFGAFVAVGAIDTGVVWLLLFGLL
jgi:hypothetical protein